MVQCEVLQGNLLGDFPRMRILLLGQRISHQGDRLISLALGRMGQGLIFKAISSSTNKRGQITIWDQTMGRVTKLPMLLLMLL